MGKVVGKLAQFTHHRDKKTKVRRVEKWKKKGGLMKRKSASNGVWMFGVGGERDARLVGLPFFFLLSSW